MDFIPIDYPAIGRRIRRLRKEKHLTQESLAELIGRSASFVGHIERGSRTLSVETLSAIVQALDCSANYLLGVGSEVCETRSSAEKILEMAFEMVHMKQS